MATVGNERYLRHILLLGKGGLLVLREIASREASTCGQPFETFLDAKRSMFNDLLDKKLFPDHSTVNTDMKTWDMSLLIKVLRKTLWKNLTTAEKTSIKILKTHRDELQAHPNCMSMEEIDYKNNTQFLEPALCKLASSLSADTNTQLQDIIKSADTGNIDIKSALQHITELNEFKEIFLQELEKIFSQVRSEIQTVHNNLKAMGKDQLERHHELSARMEKLDVVAKKSQDDISEMKEQVNVIAKLIFGQMNRTEAVAEAQRTAVKELEIILHMQGEDKVKREKATDVLYDMIKLIQTGHTFSEEKVREMIYQEIRKNGKVTLKLIEDVLAWFKCIDAIPDSCLGFAYKGSIRIPIYWFSEDAVLSLQHYMDSSEGLHCRREISSTLSEILGFSCFISWSVVLDSFTDVLKVQSKTSEAKTIVLPFHCKPDDDLIDIQKTFEKENKQTENISKTLSDIFDAKITLETFIEIDQLQKSMFKSNLSLPSYESKKTKESPQSLLDSEGMSWPSYESKKIWESPQSVSDPEGMSFYSHERVKEIESSDSDLHSEESVILLPSYKSKKMKELPQSLLDPEGISLPPYESKKMKESPKSHLGTKGVPPRSFDSKKMMELSKSRSNQEEPHASNFGDRPDSFLLRSLPWPSPSLSASALLQMRNTEGRQETSLQLVGTYSIVRDQTDVHNPHIFALEMLPKKGFIVIDRINQKLKKLDKDFKSVSVYDLSETPFDVCYIGKGKVAVSLELSGILFADVSGIIKMEKVVLLNIFCGGLAFFGNILYICDIRSHIYAYTLGDTQPRWLYHDAQGVRSTVMSLAVSQSGEKIYMMCDSGITTINAHGRQLATVQYKKSHNISDICVIDDGTILVSNLHSNNVIQINSEGTKVLRTFTLHNIKPFTICYDRRGSRLIVGGQDTNVHVYKLRALNQPDISAIS